MKKSICIAVLTLAAALPVYAATESGSTHFLLGAGLTFGGDTLATVYYTDGSSKNIKSGGQVALHGGIDYRFANKFSLQTTIGYHFDNQSATNGNLRFERYPLEVLGFYSVTEQVRLGGGIRYVMSPKIVSSGAASGNNLDFDNTTGAVLECEYLFSPSMGLKVRAVSESYKAKGGSNSISGNHGGVYFNYYF